MKYVLYALTMLLYMPCNVLCMQKSSQTIEEKIRNLNTRIDDYIEQNDIDMLIAHLFELKEKEKKKYNQYVYYALEMLRKKSFSDHARTIMEVFASDIDENCEDGLLHLAAQENNTQLIDLLVNCGSNVNEPSRLGDTPLHVAITSKSLDAIRWLVEKYSCDITKRTEVDDERFSPLELAAFCDNKEAFEYLASKGADINENIEGRTSLHIAAGNSSSITSALLEYGLDCNAIDEMDKSTPLHYATNTPAVALNTLALLLKSGAKVNALGDFGQTPLFLLISNYVRCISKPNIQRHAVFLYCTRLLCNWGANSSLIQTRSRQTALEVLVRSVYSAIEIPLESHPYIVAIVDELLRASDPQVSMFTSQSDMQNSRPSQFEILDTLNMLIHSFCPYNYELLLDINRHVVNYTKRRDNVTLLIAKDDVIHEHDMLAFRAYMQAGQMSIKDLYAPSAFLKILLHGIFTNKKDLIKFCIQYKDVYKPILFNELLSRAIDADRRDLVKFCAMHMNLNFQSDIENPFIKAIRLGRFAIALFMLSLNRNLVHGLIDNGKALETALDRYGSRGEKFVSVMVLGHSQTIKKYDFITDEELEIVAVDETSKRRKTSIEELACEEELVS